ncbi:hypothetical protein VIGAN_08000800, partial [Vigna angularis var. angularis]
IEIGHHHNQTFQMFSKFPIVANTECFFNSEETFFYLTNLGFKIMQIHIKFHQNTLSHNHVILPRANFVPF